MDMSQDVEFGMAAATNPQAARYAALIDRFTNGNLKIAEKAREKHARQNGLASDEQYRFLAGTIDTLVGKKGGHNAMLEVW